MHQNPYLCVNRLITRRHFVFEARELLYVSQIEWENPCVLILGTDASSTQSIKYNNSVYKTKS